MVNIQLLVGAMMLRENQKDMTITRCYKSLSRLLKAE
jgi:hypothetical protein